MILTPSRAVRVFAFPAAVDLRKGYDGLYGLVQTGLEQDPMTGDLFLFVNESRKMCASSRSDWSAVASRSCGVTTAKSSA